MRYFLLHYWQAGKIAARIAQWASKFAPQLIWVASDMEAISIGLHLKRILNMPLHATVYDAYECCRGAKVQPLIDYPFYMGRVTRLLREATSFDAVSQELVSHIEARFPCGPSRRSLVFPPPGGACEEGALRFTPSFDSGSAIKIGFCGSPRTSDWQWEHFLDLLGRLGRRVEIAMFADKEYFNGRWIRDGTNVRWMPYAQSDGDIIRWFRESGIHAAYLGLWREKNKRLFVETSLSSKLTTYAAAGLPVIVDAPEKSVAWRLVSRYGSGIRLAGLESQNYLLSLRSGARITESSNNDLAALARLFGDAQAWGRMSEGALRLCREEFDLERNVGKFKELLCETAASRRTEDRWESE